jgi:hypothetical protein
MGSVGGLLWTRQGTAGFQNTLLAFLISRVSASQVGFCSVELRSCVVHSHAETSGTQNFLEVTSNKRSLRGTGQHPAVSMASTRMGFCCWWLFNSLVLVRLIWTTRNAHGRMVKALAEFKFRRLGEHFCERSDYEEILLCKILYFIRGAGLLAE